MKNTSFYYGWVSIIMHWIVAISVFGLFGLGFWMVDLDYYNTWYKTAPALHKSVGLSLFLSMLFRVYWRIRQPIPNALDTHSPLEIKAGHIVHIGLYIMLFAIMTSGYLISTADNRGIEVFGLFTVPGFGSLFENQEDLAGYFHQYTAYSLIAVVALHSAAALKHHFKDKDKTLRRILVKR